MRDNIKNSENFVTAVSGKETGFATPKNYFKDSELRFSSFISEEKLPKDVSFKTPSNYFDTLEDSILEKINLPEKEVKVITLQQKLWRLIPVAVAASLILFFSLNPFQAKGVSFEAIADNDIEIWFNDSATEINTEDISFIFSDEDLIDDTFSLTSISDTSLEEYIITLDHSAILSELN